MTIETIHKYALRLATGFYGDHEKLPAMFVGVDPGDALHLIVATGWSDHKEFCCLFISGYFFVHDITMYGYCSEAWFTNHIGKQIPKNLDDLPLPSKDPNRMEGLVCGAVHADRVFQTVSRINRDAAGKGTIGEEWRPGQMDTTKQGAKVEGIMTNLVMDPRLVRPEAKEMMRTMLEMRKKMPSMTPSIPVIQIIKPHEYMEWAS